MARAAEDFSFLSPVSAVDGPRLILSRLVPESPQRPSHLKPLGPVHLAHHVYRRLLTPALFCGPGDGDGGRRRRRRLPLGLRRDMSPRHVPPPSGNTSYTYTVTSSGSSIMPFIVTITGSSASETGSLTTRVYFKLAPTPTLNLSSTSPTSDVVAPTLSPLSVPVTTTSFVPTTTSSSTLATTSVPIPIVTSAPASSTDVSPPTSSPLPSTSSSPPPPLPLSTSRQVESTAPYRRPQYQLHLRSFDTPASGTSTHTPLIASSSVAPITSSSPAASSSQAVATSSQVAATSSSPPATSSPPPASSSPPLATSSQAPPNSIVRPTVTITEIYTGPPDGTPSISKTSTRPVTSATPTTTPTPTPIPDPTPTPEPTPEPSPTPTSEANPSPTETFSYYTETLTPNPNPSFSSYVETLTTPTDAPPASSPTDTGTIIGTVSDVPTLSITDPSQPQQSSLASSLTSSHTTSATLSALPAPEGATQPQVTTSGNPSGVIAGATLGSVAGLVALGLLSRWAWKRGAGERAVRRMYREDMREIRERSSGLDEGPGEWGRPAWRRAGSGSSAGH
ncbi:hypothetical protein RhiJN_12204 [Ceratobasidium sp. AG-Ba]|nr:hypothetical protein RhiJN_12204 [Ceratobasidium sp. AG-Ba]